MKILFLKFLKQKNNLDFVFCVCLSISLFLIFTLKNNVVFYLFACVFTLGLINKIPLLVLSLFIFGLAYLVYFYTKPISLANTEIENEIFEVKNKISSGIIIQIQNQNILLVTREELNLFDQVEINGTITQPQNTSDFDFVSYLETKNIGNIIKNPKIKLLTVSNDLRNKALNYVSEGPLNYRKIAPLILLGQRNFNTKSVYDLALQLSVVHLFVISGFHISLFYLVFKKLLAFCKLKESYSALFALLPILFYLFLLNFPLSAFRAACLLTFAYINKFWFNKKFSNLTIFALVLVLFFVWKPFAIYSLSFIFTFMATFWILFVNSLKIKNKTQKYFLFLISAYFSNFLILLYVNNQFSAWGFFYTVFLSPLFVLLYLVSLVFFPFKTLLDPVYGFFIYLLEFVNEYNFFVKVASFDIQMVQVAYLLFASYLIMNKGWNLFMVKKNTLLIKK